MLDVLDRVVLSEESIKAILGKMAMSISQDYKGLNLSILAVEIKGLYAVLDSVTTSGYPQAI